MLIIYTMGDRFYKCCSSSKEVLTTYTDDELSKSIHKEKENNDNTNNEEKTQICFSLFDFCYKEDDTKRVHFNIEYITESDKKE
jgi:hypothetical protein